MSQIAEVDPSDMLDALRWHEQDRGGERLYDELRVIMAEKACTLLAHWFRQFKGEGAQNLKDICHFVGVAYYENIAFSEVEAGILAADTRVICRVMVIVGFKDKMPGPETPLPKYMLPTFVGNPL